MGSRSVEGPGKTRGCRGGKDEGEITWEKYVKDKGDGEEGGLTHPTGSTLVLTF